MVALAAVRKENSAPSNLPSQTLNSGVKGTVSNMAPSLSIEDSAGASNEAEEPSVFRAEERSVTKMSRMGTKPSVARDSEALRRQRDMLTGEAWEELFKSPAGRKDEEKLSEFWEEVRARIFHKYRSVTLALKSLDPSGMSNGEANISHLKFGDLMRALNFPLSQTVARFLFDRAAEGERFIRPDTFKALMMYRTVRTLRFIMLAWNKKQERIRTQVQNFLRNLTTCTETTTFRSVDRFQRKLTVSFVKQVWQLLVKEQLRSRTDDLAVSPMQFSRFVLEHIGTLWQVNEEVFLLNIYDKVRVLQAECGKVVDINGLVTALILLCPDSDRRAKTSLIFELFDSDYDGCLHFHQILEMCLCIGRIVPMVDPLLKGPSVFQQELSAQAGLRSYECTRWYLQRTGRVEGHDVVSMPELWKAWEAQPDLLGAVMPGCLVMHWAASPVRRCLTEVEGKSATLRAQSKNSVRRNATSAAGLGDRSSTRNSSKAVFEGRDRPKGLSQTAKLQQSVQDGFNEALQSFADLRLKDLMVAWQPTPTQVDSAEVPGKRHHVSTWEALEEDVAMSSPPASRPGSSASSSRPVSALGSSGHRSLLAEKKPTFLRSNSAPMPLQVAAERRSPGAELTDHGQTTPRGLSSSKEFKPFRTQKWGAEAVERARLVSCAKIWAAKRPKAELSDPSINGQTFRCQLCLQSHTVCPGHGVF